MYTKICDAKVGGSSHAHICEMKLLFLIFAVFDLLICFFLHFMKSCSFKRCSCFSLSRHSHNHSGYSLSSNATGSSPFFLIFKFKTVPAGTEDKLNAFLVDEKSLAGDWKRRTREIIAEKVTVRMPVKSR